MPKSSSIRRVVSIRHRLVTDRQTEGLLPCDHSVYRASIASQGKNRGTQLKLPTIITSSILNVLTPKKSYRVLKWHRVARQFSIISSTLRTPM